MTNSSHSPLYQQVKDDILQQIKKNLLRPGDKLPTEETLTNYYHVSRITISKALNELKEEGVVIGYPGKGTFVHSPTPRPAASPPDAVPKPVRTAVDFKDMREIACIFPDIKDGFALSMINGIQSVFPADQYICHIFQSKTAAIENQLLRYCQQKNIAGLVLFSQEYGLLSNELLSLHQDNYPFVLVDHTIPWINCSYVIGDHEASGALCISHLHKLGHNHIAFVTAESKEVTAIRLRMNGCKKKAAELNMIPHAIHVVERLDLNKKEIYYSGIFRKLIYEDKITAFIASDTGCFSYLYHLFQFMNISIPNDVSLLSFDNPQTNIAGMNYFTHIKQSEYKMGREAGKILLQKLEQKDTHNYQKLIPPELVINQSSGSVL